MLTIVGVCAILLTVFAGLGLLLGIVLRGTETDDGKKVVMLALRELITGVLAEVAKLPGRLAQSFAELRQWPSSGSQVNPPMEPGMRQQPNPIEQKPPTDPHV